jgi:hypothetical protein
MVKVKSGQILLSGKACQASAITSELPVTREELADPFPQRGATPSTINMRLFAALCLIGLIAA